MLTQSFTKKILSFIPQTCIKSCPGPDAAPGTWTDKEKALGVHFFWNFPDGSSGKESSCQCRRPKRRGFDPWVRKIPWSRNCNPFQYSCLENPRDRGDWWAPVNGVAKSWIRLSNWSMHMPTLERQSPGLTCDSKGSWSCSERKPQYSRLCVFLMDYGKWEGRIS